MHIKYCKTDGQNVLSVGRQSAYSALIVPLDKREKSGLFLFMFLSFSESIKKAKHFVAHTHTHTHTHKHTGCLFLCN
jgi:hypothetical protein